MLQLKMEEIGAQGIRASSLGQDLTPQEVRVILEMLPCGCGFALDVLNPLRGAAPYV